MPARSSRRRSEPVPPPLHELEAEVMAALWRTGEAPVRQIMQALNKGGKERAYTTYMTIMARLHRKGLLTRRRHGKTDFYAPRYEREAYMTLRVRAEVEHLVATYGDTALSQFAQQLASLDPARRRTLQRLARQQR